jgi:hypothetical protein
VILVIVIEISIVIWLFFRAVFRIIHFPMKFSVGGIPLMFLIVIIDSTICCSSFVFFFDICWDITHILTEYSVMTVIAIFILSMVLVISHLVLKMDDRVMISL